MNYTEYPSVSKILRATESEKSKAFLKDWADRIGIEAAAQIKEDSMARGTVIDNNVAEYFVTGDCDNKMIKTYLQQFKIIENEQDVWSDIYKYKGRFDQLMEKDGRLLLNDFKGSGKLKQKQWLGDNPVQLAAYYFALHERGVKVDYAQLSYVVDGQKDIQKFVFGLPELKKYYDEFLERLKQYNENSISCQSS